MPTAIPSPTIARAPRKSLRELDSERFVSPAVNFYSLQNCVNCRQPYTCTPLQSTTNWVEYYQAISDHWKNCRENVLARAKTSGIRRTLFEKEEEIKKTKGSEYRVILANLKYNPASMMALSSSGATMFVEVPQTRTDRRGDRANVKNNLQTDFLRSPMQEQLHLDKSPFSSSSRLSTITELGWNNDSHNLSSSLPVVSPPHHSLPNVGSTATESTSFEDVLPATGVLPPRVDRKRKRSTSLHTDEEEEDIRPIKKALSMVESHDEQSLETQGSRRKNVMDRDQRRKNLEADEFLSVVEATRVHCKQCQKWIKLDKRNDYYPGLWNKHKMNAHILKGQLHYHEPGYECDECRTGPCSPGMAGRPRQNSERQDIFKDTKSKSTVAQRKEEKDVRSSMHPSRITRSMSRGCHSVSQVDMA